MELIAYLNAVFFRQPAWLWAMLFTLPLTAGLMLRQRLSPLHRLPDWPARRLARHPRWHLLAGRAGPGGAAPPRPATLAWTLLTLFFLQLALAQPCRPGRQLPAPQTYRDTVFLVDASVSMVLRDYQAGAGRIDRMSMVKGVLTHFIEQLDTQGHDNRIGLVAFSATPYALVPPTTDFAVVADAVRRLRPAVLTGRVSDPGKALLYVADRFGQDPAGGMKRRPMLVMLTDLNRPSRRLDPRRVAAHLRRQGFVLHTIGIGAPSPRAAESGAGGLVYRPPDFALLEAMAEAGGGGFHWADSLASLETAIRAIQQGGRRATGGAPRYLEIPLYHWPLGLGLAMLMLAAVRRQRGGGEGA